MADLTPDEMRELFIELHDKLKAPFPEGTVQYRDKNNPKTSYIPVQAYIHRVNEVAGPHLVNWRITTPKPIIHEEEDVLEMRGILTILGTSYEGQGFQDIHRFNDTKKIKNYEETIKAAVSNAFKSAADFFELGWKDLNREWVTNPGVGIVAPNKVEKHQPPQSTRRCIKCQQPLTPSDEQLLREAAWKQDYCEEHLPDFVKRKLNR